MSRFIIERYTMVSCNRCEYKGVKVNGKGWFEANSTDEAIAILHGIMDATTYILKIQNDSGYNPIYKVIKNKDGEIKVLNDKR